MYLKLKNMELAVLAMLLVGHFTQKKFIIFFMTLKGLVN